MQPFECLAYAFFEGRPRFLPVLAAAGFDSAVACFFGPGFLAPGLFLLPFGRPRLPVDLRGFFPKSLNKESKFDVTLVFRPLPVDSEAIMFAASTRTLMRRSSAVISDLMSLRILDAIELLICWQI